MELAHRVYAPPRLQPGDPVPVVSGKPNPLMPTQLSWRVHLLPYVGYRPLYEKFKLNEPWDSVHNKSLLQYMPEIFRVQNEDEGTTCVRAFTGDGTILGNGTPALLKDILDPAGGVIAAIVVGDDRAVPWTQPDDFPIDPANPKATLGHYTDGLIHCVTMDRMPLTLPTSVADAELLSLTTISGMEAIEIADIRKKYNDAEYESTPFFGPLMKLEDAEPGSHIEQWLKLQAIVAAFRDYHRENSTLPVFGTTPGKSMLSWRVHLLPYLGEKELYEKFRHNEPWDSPDNMAASKTVPAVYRIGPATQPQSQFHVFTGPGMMLGNSTQQDWTPSDGTENTIFVLAVPGEITSLHWTHPQDLEFNPQTIAALLATARTKPLETIAMNGKLLTIPSEISEEALTALITPFGSDLSDAAAQRRISGPYRPPMYEFLSEGGLNPVWF